MPNDDEFNANKYFTTAGTDWTVSNVGVDINAVYNKTKPPMSVSKKLKMKKEEKKMKKKKQVFRCDWCGKDFKATREEVDPDKHHGYYCIDNPRCKIEGKYGRSMLDKELFELDEDEANDVPNE